MISNSFQNPGFAPVILVAVVIFVLIAIVVGILPYWKIFSKAGFSGWLALCMLLPLVNLVVLYVVAFSPWNVQPYRQQVFPPSVPPGQQQY